MQIPFIYTPPKISNNLPCTLISLEQWALIKISGVDTIKYLQGQLTCNLETLKKQEYTFAAHCNPQGKMISNMYVFHLKSGIALVEKRNICQKQICAMEKYAIFSKVTIQLDDNATLLGIAGFDAKIKLQKIFKTLPDKITNIIYDHDTTILYFNDPTERFLLITTQDIQTKILSMLNKQIEINNSLQWIVLDIEAGYPLIHTITSEKFIPQSANMHILNGISFNKGCYIGQETIARAKYKNINKYSLYQLIGNSKHLPKPGNNLEVKIKNNWNYSGTILEACRINTHDIIIQAILNNKISKDSQFRIQNQNHNNIFNIYYFS